MVPVSNKYSGLETWPGEMQPACLGDNHGESQAMSSSVPPLSRHQVRVWVLCVMKLHVLSLKWNWG